MFPARRGRSSTQRHGCGDCDLDRAGVGYGNAYPGWNRPKESESAFASAAGRSQNCTGLLALRPRLTTGLPLSASPLVERRKNANQRVQFTQGPNVSSHLLATSPCTILAGMSVRDQLLD